MRLIIWGAVSVLASPLLLAQTPLRPQVEQSRLFTAPPPTVDLQGQRNAPQAEGISAPGITDDAFGAQVLFKRQEVPRYFNAFAEIGAFTTNNVALTKANPLQDSFLVATAGASFSRPFAYNLRFDLSARASGYRYDKFSQLDFQSTDLSAGAAWAPPLLRGAEMFARYTFTDLTTAVHTREFYKNHAILLGIQKVIPFSRAQSVYFGGSAQWSFADPKPAGRDEYTAFAGYRVQLTRHVDADLSYRYSRYVYCFAQGRHDNNQTLSLGLHYYPTEWLSFSTTGFLAADRSNRKAFDYDVANLGVGLQFSLSF